MKFIFLVGSYYPYASAVGNCAFMLIKELVHKHEIIVICEKNFPELKSQEIYKKHLIVRIKTTDIDKRLKYMSITHKNGKDRIRKKVGLFFLRTKFYLNSLFSRVNIKKDLVEAYLQELCRICNTNERTILVPCCFPYETIIAAIQYKKQNINVSIAPYLFDRFADSATLHRLIINKYLKWNSHIKLEHNMVKNSDIILFISAWEKHLYKYFKNYSDRFLLIEHPLLSTIETSKVCLYDKKKINLVYTGALSKKERSPQYILKLLKSELQINNDICLHFYIMGDCNDEIKQLSKEFPTKVFNYGSVDMDTAHAAMLAADFLIAIGNKHPNQVSSKIFEYISAQKPIIFSYKKLTDPLCNLLESYPASFMIDERTNISTNIKAKFHNFIITSHHISSEKIRKTYSNAIPNYTTKYLENLANNFLINT